MVLELPENVKRAFEEGKAKATVTTYSIMASKLFKELFGTEQFSVDKLRDVEKVRAYIENKDRNKDLSLTSKKMITIALVMLLKAAKAPQGLIDAYGKMARDFRIKDAKMRKDRIPTERERAAVLDWDQIIEIRKVYKDCLNDPKCIGEMTEGEYKRWYMKYVVLCLYTMIPPQRGQVFYNCYIDKDVPEANIFDTTAKQLIIRNEKTTKSYGIRTIKVPTELNDIVKEWKRVSNSELLMPNAKGSAMSSPAWTQFMKSVFKRDVSTDMLRKIYVSHMIGDKGISMEERVKLADQMGHSASMQQHGYHKTDW